MSFSNDDSRSLLELAATSLLILLLTATPWLFGGVMMQHQLYLWLAALLCVALTWMSGLSNPVTDGASFPWWMVPVLLFLGVGALQLLPLTFAMSNWTHVALPEWFPALSSRATWTIDPALTRVQLLRFVGGAALMWGASQLLASTATRQILWWSLAINGSLLSIFGVVQRLWWNGKLFWFVELTHGGQPFASFVNRNHAAGYLNLCCAAALLLWWSYCNDSSRKTSPESANERQGFGREVLPALLVMVNVMGVCASLSRGGILSLVAALLAVVMFSDSQFRSRVLVLLVLTGVALGVLLNSTDQGEMVRDRLSTLQESSIRADGRWQHWQDTLPAVLDAPWGTGLGTYRLANRPFQDHPTPGLFHNADNLYLDMFVEMGWLGIGLIATTLLFLIWRVWQLSRHSNPVARSLSLLGVLLLATQCLQSATDFGPLMTANLMTIAVLCGTLFVAIPALNEEDPSSDLLHARSTNLVVGGVLILACLPLVPVLQHASEVEAAVRNLPEDSKPVSLATVTLPLAGTERLLRQFPDDGAVQLIRAKLLVLAYRAQVFDEIRKQAPQAEEQLLWTRTALPYLYELVLNQDDEADRVQIRAHAAVQRYLVSAVVPLRAAINASPLQTESRALLGMVLPLITEGADSTQWFCEEASLVPDSPERLLQLGVLLKGDESRLDRERMWGRALSLRPVRPGQLIKRMIMLTSESEAASLIPPDSSMWLAFIRSVRTADVRQQAANQLLLLSDQMHSTDGESDFAAGVALATLEDWNKAVTRLRLAVNSQPELLEWRLELISALEAAGLREEAHQHLEIASRQAPGRRDLQRRLQEH